MVAACWSPAIPEIAIGPPNRSAVLSPNRAEESFTSGSIERGTRKRLIEIVVPRAGVDVEQQRARGVGGVGGVHAAAGEPPQQIAVDGAEQQLAALGAFARARHVIEDPGDFGAREIRIDDQAGLGRDRRLMAFGLQPGADVGGAAVLPRRWRGARPGRWRGPTPRWSRAGW